MQKTRLGGNESPLVPPKTNDNLTNEEKGTKESEQATVQYLMETVQSLQKENELLKHEVLKSKRTPSYKIGLILLAVGALTLIYSVVATSSVLAFIGLGLTFWGALFMFARPLRFVPSNLLDSTAISSYTTIDRMIQDLDYKGKPFYIPPYPEEAYLPEYLKGLKEMTVFIPAEDTFAMPRIEEMAKRQFFLKNPRGICIAPPGYGLLSLIEKELKTKLTQISIDRLRDTLPAVVVDSLELAREFEIDQENDLVHVKMIDSVYKDLYSSKENFKSVHSIGCPLASAIACTLAKATAKLVAVARSAVSPDLRTIEIWYQTLEV